MRRFAALPTLALATLVLGACSAPATAAPPLAPAPTTAPAPTIAAMPTAAPASTAPSPIAAGTAAPARTLTPRTIVNGKVKGLDANTLTLDNGQSFLLGDTTSIRRSVPITAADLKPGMYVGVTAKRQPDNTLLASMVNVIPGGGQSFQRPMAGGNLMTNAAIDTVEGDTFTVKWEGGGAKIKLAPDAKLHEIESGTRDDLKPGVGVMLVQSGGAVTGILVQPPA